MKTNNWILFLLAWILMLPASAQMKPDDNIVIREKVNKDLYVAGGTVTINAPINGDLIAAGGTITVSDTISSDILVAGGNIYFNGYVGDDIRCAGGNIRISRDVAGDVVVAGGTITIEKGVVVHGNLLASGGEITVDGEIQGDIKTAAGTFTLNGKAGHDIDCRGGEITINGIVGGNSVLAAKEIEVGADASFEGEVKYWNKNGSPDFTTVMHHGKPVFDPSLEIQGEKLIYLGFASVLIALWYLGMALVMIFLIQYLFSTTMKTAAGTVKTASLKSLGLGSLFLIGVPIAIVLSAITIIGLPVSILLLIGYITILVLATAIVSLLIAHGINNYYYEFSWSDAKISLVAFGIFIFLKLASLTPVIGPLIMLLLVCLALGGILQNIHWKRNKALTLT